MPDDDRGRARQRRLASARSPRSPPRRTSASRIATRRPATLQEHTHARGRQGVARCSASTPPTCACSRPTPAHRLQPAAIDAALHLDREARPASRSCVVGTAGTTSTGCGRPARRPRRPRRPRGPVVPRRRRLRRARPADAAGRGPAGRHRARRQRSCSTRTSGSSSPTRSARCCVREPGLLEHAFTLDGAYLRDTKGGVVEFRERGPQLTRGARALKLWLSLQRLRPRRLQGGDRARASRSPSTPSDAAASDGGWEVVSPATLGDRLLPPRRRRRRADGRDGASRGRRRLRRAEHDDPRRAHASRGCARSIRAPPSADIERTIERLHARALRHLNTRAHCRASVRSGTFARAGCHGRGSKGDGALEGTGLCPVPRWQRSAYLVAVLRRRVRARPLTVDDDGRIVPAAAYTSVQAAVDAAAPGDTVAICPGDVRRGRRRGRHKRLIITATSRSRARAPTW